MAEIYRRVKGKKITKVIAQHRDVQRAVDDAAVEGALRAMSLLDTRSKERTGTSTIGVDKGDIDAYVVLDDTRGLHAALSIEYGRAAEEREVNGRRINIGPAEGLFVLHDAFGLRR